MATDVRKIRITVDSSKARGLRKLSNEFGRMNRNVKGIRSNLSGLSRVAQVAFAGIGVREITQSADAFQLLRDRIRVFTGSAEQANDVFDDINILAARTRSSVQNFAEAYNRVAIATKGIGVTSDQTLGVVSALQQSLRLSGASAAEANSVFIQLSQALSLGRLQGQELRSVLLSNAVVAQILAKEFDTNTGALRELGEQGKITTDRVLKALADNFDDLIQKGDNLGTTFEQAAIIGIDELRRQIDILNSRFNLSGNFLKGINFLTKNLEDVLKIAGSLVAGKLFIKLGAHVIFFYKQVEKALKGTAALTGGLKLTRVALFAVSFAISYLSIEALTDWENFTLKANKAALKFNIFLTDLNLSILKFVETVAEATGSDVIGKFTASIKTLEAIKLKKLNNDLEGIEKQLASLAKKENDPEDIIARLKKAFEELDGTNVANTVSKFSKLNQAFDAGSIKIREYRREVDKIAINELDEDFRSGKITVDQYNESLLKIKNAFSDKSTVEQFFEGIRAGSRQANNEIGSLAQEVAGATSNAFSTLENQLFDFVKTGKLRFKDFAQSVLDDLTRIAIRMTIIRSLTDATSSLGGGAPNTPVANANGNAFNNGNVVPFANGGAFTNSIVSRPTVFPMANGTGLMGESGPEGILPLKRGRGGRLGVEASGAGTVVNVINNNGSDVETTERTGENGEKQIDVLITNKMNKAIREGKLDKTLNTTYGLNRRGA